jgi:hypothetical protein
MSCSGGSAGYRGYVPFSWHAGQTAHVRVAAAVLVALAVALWWGWATRDFHDNQRNWLLVLAMASTGAALLSSLASAVWRRRNRE